MLPDFGDRPDGHDASSRIDTEHASGVEPHGL
jgi:hypothetical protein